MSEKNEGATKAQAWMKSIDAAQEAELAKILKPEQVTKLKAFKAATALPTIAEIKSFVESIDASQKAKVAKVLKPAQLAELFQIARLLK